MSKYPTALMLGPAVILSIETTKDDPPNVPFIAVDGLQPELGCYADLAP